VREECTEAFRAWQHALNCAAGDYPGFLAAEVAAPTDRQPDWVVVYRFDSVANVLNWINSATRQGYLDAGSKYFDGPATQQVVTGGTQPYDPLVTVVVSHRVTDEHIDDFLAWQERLTAEENKFHGFRGSELFRPVEGVQDDWTALYRFDTAADLDAWLTSDRRQQLLAEGERFSDFELRTVDSSFGSWFAFDQNGNEAPPPSETKTSIAIWVGLYPTVVLLTLALSPLKLPLWLGLLIGNLLSSLIMSFFTMRFYVNPLLGRWLRPPAQARQPATNLQGVGLVLAVNAVWMLAFYLITVRFWTLP